MIRQFVAMPLGAGYTAEEQITRKAEHGGIQIIAYPMKRDVFERRFPKQELLNVRLLSVQAAVAGGEILCDPCADMGLAPGGRMRQQIYDDPYDANDWDLSASSRCFIHLANSMVWRQITGENPPTVPPTSKEYNKAGLPWFDYYSDSPSLDGGKKLKKLGSVAKLGKAYGDKPLPENQPVDPKNVVQLRKGLKKGQVREGTF